MPRATSTQDAKFKTDLSVIKAEYEIDESINRFSDSIDELRQKLDRPIQKVKLYQRKYEKIKKGPWGVISVVLAFTIGFLIMRSRR